MKIRIRYFAALREQANKTEEILDFDGDTLEELYDHLALEYGFTLEKNQLKYALNDEFIEPSASLSENDLVVFIPPVAGG